MFSLDTEYFMTSLRAIIICYVWSNASCKSRGMEKLVLSVGRTF